MSEPNYGQNGWERWRGDVTATLRALEEGQDRIEKGLAERDARNSGRIGRMENEISGVHKRIEAVESRWTWAALSALAALVMALFAWITRFIQVKP